MKFPLLNPGISAAIGYVLVVAGLGIFAIVWFGAFGFSFWQLVADLALVTMVSLGAAVTGGPTFKKWNI